MSTIYIILLLAFKNYVIIYMKLDSSTLNKLGGIIMKINLLKNEPKFYEVRSSKKEVYETECCFLLKVIDCSRALEKISKISSCYNSVDEILKDFFEEFKEARVNCSFNKYVYETINTQKYNVVVSIIGRSDTRIAEVKISRRRVKEKICSTLKNILYRLLDIEEYYY